MRISEVIKTKQVRTTISVLKSQALGWFRDVGVKTDNPKMDHSGLQIILS